MMKLRLDGPGISRVLRRWMSVIGVMLPALLFGGISHGRHELAVSVACVLLRPAQSGS